LGGDGAKRGGDRAVTGRSGGTPRRWICSLEPPSVSSEAAEEERPMDGMGAVGEVTTAAGEAAAAPPLTSMPALDAL
jgi:hypothetical protein